MNDLALQSLGTPILHMGCRHHSQLPDPCSDGGAAHSGSEVLTLVTSMPSPGATCASRREVPP